MRQIMKIDNIAKSIPQDTDYPYISLPGLLLTAVDLKPDVFEVEDQGSIGSCTCNSSVSACEMFTKESYSRLFPYWQTRNVIESRAGQEGASLRDAIRSHFHFGLPLETQWVYDVTKENVQPPTAAYADAFTRRVTRYENISITAPDGVTMRPQDELIRDIQSALNEGLPVVFAASVGNLIFGLKGPWQTHVYPRCDTPFENNNNPIVGFHAILIVGYDFACKRFLVQNSWGPGYGDGGFFGMPYETLHYDICEAWVIRGFKDKMIAQPPVPAPLDPKYKLDPKDVLTTYRNMRPTPPTDINDPYVQWCATNLTDINQIYDLGIKYLQSLKT